MEQVVAVAVLVPVVVQIRPDDPRNIFSLFAADELHAPQRVCEKDDAE